MKNSLGCAMGAVAAACLLLCSSLPVSAQTAPAPDAAAGGASERASREGDKVFKWILMHSDKPRNAAKEAPVAAAAPAPAVKDVAARAETRPAAETPRPVARTESRLAAPIDKSALAASGSAATAPAVAAAPAAQSSTVASALPSVPAPLPDIPAPAEDDYEEPLVLAKQVDPEFPGGVMRTLRKGTVQVKFMVQADGSVDTVEIVKTTSVRLNTAAAAAVAQWRFMPLKHAQSGIVELGFNLD